MQVYGIDSDFLETYGIELIAGRNLRSRESNKEAFLLNETAVRKLGWDSYGSVSPSTRSTPSGRSMRASHRTGVAAAIGKRFEQVNVKSGSVVGVVKDFHTQSLHSPIEPVVMHHWAQHTITARISGDDIQGALAHLKKTWSHYLPGIPFERWFVDQNLVLWYRDDEQLSESCTLFSLLAVFVACLGLFGLASYTAEQRTKEIGIRKVLGATVSGIVFTFSREFVKLIVIANLVAAPVAYYLMRNWLDNFSYRIDLSSSPFLLCGGATLAIAILTVSYQYVRAGSVNPVEALRHE